MRLYTAAALLSITVVTLGYAGSVSAQTMTCASGTAHLATQQEADSATGGGIIAGKTYVCPNDTRLGISNTVGQAKDYLKSMLCAGSNFGGAGADGTIEGLNNNFAVCAAKFVQAENQNPQITGGVSLLKGGSAKICVREGYRTPQQQQLYYQQYLNHTGGLACAKGANCEHPKGIAMDVNVATHADYQMLWSQGPQYSVNFYLRDRDKVHFVPTASSCSGGGQGSTAPGTPTTLPSTSYDFPQYYTTPTFPNSSLPYSSALPFSSGIPSLSPLTSPLTGALAAPTPTPPPAQPAPQVCTPAFSCTNGTMYYQTSACTTQVYQVCSNGCSGNSCAAASSTIVTNPLATSSIFDTGDASSATNTPPSVSEILSQLTGYTFGTSTDVGTSSSIAFSLNPTTGDVAQLGTIGTGIHAASNSIASIQPTNSQQTFTSGDLSAQNSFNGSVPAGSSTGLQSILSGMTAALQWALNVLRSL